MHPHLVSQHVSQRVTGMPRWRMTTLDVCHHGFLTNCAYLLVHGTGSVHLIKGHPTSRSHCSIQPGRHGNIWDIHESYKTHLSPVE